MRVIFMAIIQHVVTRQGPPTEAPPSTGAHYIDVSTKRQWISIGSNTVEDWGDPVGEVLPRGGLIGQIVQWINGGAVWVDYDQGATKEYVDAQDAAVLAAAEAYVDNLIEAGDFILETDVDALDAQVLANAKAYYDAEEAAVNNLPPGGTTGEVLTKLSATDGHVGWAPLPDPGVPEQDVLAQLAATRTTVDSMFDAINEVPPGGVTQAALTATGAGGKGAYEWRVPEVVPVHHPIIISPTNESDLPATVTLSAGIFLPAYSCDQRVHREFQVALASGDYANPVASHTANVDEWTVALTTGQDYKWRVRDLSDYGDYSVWTEAFFSTSTVYFTTTVTVDVVDGFVPVSPTINAAHNVVGGSDTVTAVDWIILKNNAVEWASYNDTVNINSINVPEGMIEQGETYVFKARARGTVAGWGVPGEFTGSVRTERYLTVTTAGTPTVRVFNQDVDEFTQIATPIEPTGTPTSSFFNADGKILAVAHNTSPFITFYRREVDAFTKLANPTFAPTGAATDVAFDASGLYVAVTHNVAPYLTVYKRFDDVMIRLTISGTVPTDPTSVIFVGSSIVIGHAAAPYVTKLTRTNEVYTVGSAPFTPPGAVTDIEVSVDESTVVLTSSASPYIQVYSQSNESFTPISLPGTFIPDGANVPTNCSISGTGNVISFGLPNAPYIQVFKKTNGILTVVEAPTTTPNGSTVTSVNPTGTHIVALYNAVPYATVYTLGEVLSASAGAITINSPPAGKPSWYYFV